MPRMSEFIIIWTVLIVLSVVVEAITTQLVSIWFAIGSLAALVIAVCELPFYAQIIIFFIVSGITLAVFWILKNKFSHSSPPQKTNYDRIIGQEAIVTLQIDNVAGSGQIVVSGQHWTARSCDDIVIDNATRVEIVAIEGVKAMVKPI